jgi:hypothetical protein
LRKKSRDHKNETFFLEHHRKINHAGLITLKMMAALHNLRQLDPISPSGKTIRGNVIGRCHFPAPG